MATRKNVHLLFFISGNGGFCKILHICGVNTENELISKEVVKKIMEKWTSARTISSWQVTKCGLENQGKDVKYEAPVRNTIYACNLIEVKSGG